MNICSIYKSFLCALCAALLAACSLEPADDTPTKGEPTANDDRLLILCEGLWGMNNAPWTRLCRLPEQEGQHLIN